MSYKSMPDLPRKPRDLPGTQFSPGQIILYADSRGTMIWFVSVSVLGLLLQSANHDHDVPFN